MNRLMAQVVPAVREPAIVAVLYAAYSGARSFADGDLAKALEHAVDLEPLEDRL